MTPEWDKVAAWAHREIKAGRDALEQGNSDQVRGRIAALRDLLRLATPEVDDPSKRIQPPDYGIITNE